MRCRVSTAAKKCSLPPSAGLFPPPPQDNASARTAKKKKSEYVCMYVREDCTLFTFVRRVSGRVARSRAKHAGNKKRARLGRAGRVPACLAAWLAAYRSIELSPSSRAQQTTGPIIVQASSPHHTHSRHRHGARTELRHEKRREPPTTPARGILVCICPQNALQYQASRVRV